MSKKVEMHTFTQTDDSDRLFKRVTGIRFKYANADLNNYIIGIDIKTGLRMSVEDLKKINKFFSEMIFDHNQISDEIEKEIEDITKPYKE